MRTKRKELSTILFVLSLFVLISVFPLSAVEKKLTPEFEEAYVKITSSLRPDQLTKVKSASLKFMKDAGLFTEGADILKMAKSAADSSGLGSLGSQNGVKFILAHGAKVIGEDIGEVKNSLDEIGIVKTNLKNYIKNLNERIADKGGADKANLKRKRPGRVKGFGGPAESFFQSRRSKNYNIEYFSPSKLEAPKFLGRKDLKELSMLKVKYEKILREVESKEQKTDLDLQNAMSKQTQLIQAVMNTIKSDHNTRMRSKKNIR
ncbi:MAG: hypothetical protein ABFR75_09815 [Acidobacteriota bacterium]